MTDFEEREVSFEEIGFSDSEIKPDSIPKFINIKLKIKRPSKYKHDFKGTKLYSDIENISTAPSKSIPAEEAEKKSAASQNIPTLCNGTNCPTTDQILSAIEELRDIVKKSCSETRNIRRELLYVKNAMHDDNPSYIPFMRGPCQTMDDLNLLEYRVQEDEAAREALERLLSKIDETPLERYVRFCLKAIISEKLAAECTWHGRKESTLLSVHDMVIIGVICCCAQKKFPKASSPQIVKVMKRWFYSAKDRWGKKMGESGETSDLIMGQQEK